MPFSSYHESVKDAVCNAVRFIKEGSFPGPEYKYSISGDPLGFEKLFGEMEAEWEKNYSRGYVIII